MDSEQVRSYFNEASAVLHYAKAVANVGLWESEKLLLDKWFDKESEILDLGCGAGRLSIGLWKMGFTSVLGADLAEQMVEEAREIADCVGCPFSFQREDATRLSFPDASFNNVVFAFNGLMQIPGKASRLRALREVRRVLRPGGLFLFSTLDREDPLYRRVFADASDPDHDLSRNAQLVDYGDRHFVTEHGTTFMHVPTRAEVKAALRECGFALRFSEMRSAIARETAAVLSFSEDCRLWVAQA